MNGTLLLHRTRRRPRRRVRPAAVPAAAARRRARLLERARRELRARALSFPAGGLVAARRRRSRSCSPTRCSSCSALAPTLDPRVAPAERPPSARSRRRSSASAYGAGARAVRGHARRARRRRRGRGCSCGFAVVGLAQRAAGPVIARARARLADRAAREALTIYLDAASLLVAALVALLHPLGYVARGAARVVRAGADAGAPTDEVRRPAHPAPLMVAAK